MREGADYLEVWGTLESDGMGALHALSRVPSSGTRD